jgi:S1-C subfamily serine protease
LLYAVNGCDLNSLVADPGFKDPASGDYSVRLDGPASRLGFVNFEMSAFGVVSPKLRARAKTPVLPAIHVEPDTSLREVQKETLNLWKDAQLSEPRGEALSAYGVSLDATGVAMVRVPEFSEAWGLGLRTGDYITEVNGEKVESVDHFLSLMKNFMRKKKGQLTLIRSQEELVIRIK